MHDILKKYKKIQKGRRRISFLSLQARKHRPLKSVGSTREPASMSWHKVKSA